MKVALTVTEVEFVYRAFAVGLAVGGALRLLYVAVAVMRAR